MLKSHLREMQAKGLILYNVVLLPRTMSLMSLLVRRKKSVWLARLCLSHRLPALLLPCLTPRGRGPRAESQGEKYRSDIFPRVGVEGFLTSLQRRQ